MLAAVDQLGLAATKWLYECEELIGRLAVETGDRQEYRPEIHHQLLHSRFGLIGIVESRTESDPMRQLLQHGLPGTLFHRLAHDAGSIAHGAAADVAFLSSLGRLELQRETAVLADTGKNRRVVHVDRDRVRLPGKHQRHLTG